MSKEFDALERILTDIREYVHCRFSTSLAAEHNEEEEFGFVQVNPIMDDSTLWWSKFNYLFVQNFDDTHDDLLFFVKNDAIEDNFEETDSSSTKATEGPFFVLRHTSPNLPTATTNTVNWEETFYLNLVLHSFEYILTIIVGTPAAKPTHAVQKVVKKVFASPSKTRHNQKGSETELTYPLIYFTVEDFDDIFKSIVCEEGQTVCVELTANCGTYRTAIFQGAVGYDSLLDAYNTKRGSQWDLGLLRPTRPMEFLKMRGPNKKGQAQMAVSVMLEPGEEPESKVSKLFGNISRGFGSVSTEAKPLNACLTFVNINMKFIIVDFLKQTPTKPVLDNLKMKSETSNTKNN